MYRKRNYILLTLLALFIQSAIAQKIAIKNNLLLDGAMAPNIGLELVTGERTSVAFDIGGAYHPWWGKQSKIIMAQPELRYWFNGRPMTRQYVGVVGLATHYDMHFGHEIQKGNATGIGLSFGYDMSLGKRLVLDCSASFGAAFYSQRQYFQIDKGADNPDDWFADGGSHNNASGYILTPLKIGVSISYILK